MVRLPRNEKQTNILIELWASNVTISFDHGHDHDLGFSRSNVEFAMYHPKMVRLPRNKKQTYRLNSRPQMWPSGMTLTLNFQGQISNLLYLSQKWSDFHETKSNYIDWTLCLKCDHQVWPWPWPWPRIFKVKYGICYIATKSGPIVTKRKANSHLWIFKVKCDLDLWPHTGPWPWIAVSQNGRANWHWTKGVGVGHSWLWLWPFGDQGQV